MPDHNANFGEVLNEVDVDAESGNAFFSLEAGFISVEDAQNITCSCLLIVL